jgi:hypothetical protein
LTVFISKPDMWGCSPRCDLHRREKLNLVDGRLKCYRCLWEEEKEAKAKAKEKEKEKAKAKARAKAEPQPQPQLEVQIQVQVQASADAVEYPEEYKGPDPQECPPYSAAPWTPPQIICCRCQAIFATDDELY